MNSFGKLLAAALLLLSGATLFAETKTIDIGGSGKTMKIAYKNACKKAIRQIVSEIPDAKIEVMDEEFLESVIRRSAGVITSAKLINRRHNTGAGLWIAQFRISVDTDNLKSRMSAPPPAAAAAGVVVNSQIGEAKDIETQEKNAMKLLQWWTKEFCTTICFPNVKIESENGKLFLYFTERQDNGKAKLLAAEVARVLTANGYKSALLKGNRGSGYLDPNRFKGSTFVTKYINKGGYASENPYEVYNNPNACLFWGKDSNKHPQNFSAHCFKSHFEIVAVKQDNSKTLLTRQDIELKEIGIRQARVNFRFADESCDVCSLMPMVFPEKIKKFNGIYKKQISQDEIAGAVSLQVNLVHVAENGEGAAETVTVATFPLANAEQLIGSAKTQGAALAKRSQGFSDVVTKYLHDIYKCIDVKADYKYNRFKKNGELHIALSTNLREYAKWNRSFIAALESMNVKVEEKGLSTLPRAKKGTTSIWVKYKWHAFLPDRDRAAYKKIHAELSQYRYYVVVQLKDASGEVLLRKKYKLASGYDRTQAPFQYGNFSDCYNQWGEARINSGIDWGQFGNNGKIYNTYKRNFVVNFDVPEDAQKVSTVECAVVEEKQAD